MAMTCIDLPEEHPRERLVRRTEDKVREAVLQVTREAQLTRAETALVMSNVLGCHLVRNLQLEVLAERRKSSEEKPPED